MIANDNYGMRNVAWSTWFRGACLSFRAYSTGSAISRRKKL